MVDRDLKRNAERRFTGFALAGMLIYPFIILLASVLGFDQAANLNYRHSFCIRDCGQWCRCRVYGLQCLFCEV